MFSKQDTPAKAECPKERGWLHADSKPYVHCLLCQAALATGSLEGLVVPPAMPKTPGPAATSAGAATSREGIGSAGPPVSRGAGAGNRKLADDASEGPLPWSALVLPNFGVSQGVAGA